jgi:glycine dehydrogenase subunit 1
MTNGKPTAAIHEELLRDKIVGGLPLDRFYPELAGCVLLCATEMNKRTDMDKIAAAWQASRS